MYPPATDQGRQAGIYLGRLLKGEKPADLRWHDRAGLNSSSIWQPREHSASKVPPGLLSISDEVIE
jgi:hypothetical protein